MHARLRIRRFAAQYNIGGFVRVLHTKLEVQLRRRKRVKAKASFDASYWAGHKEVAALELKRHQLVIFGLVDWIPSLD